MSNDSIVLHPPNHSDWLRDGHMTQVRQMSVKPRLFPAILEEYFSTPYTPTLMFTSKGPRKQQTSLLFAKSCLTMKSTQESKAKKWKERDNSTVIHQSLSLGIQTCLNSDIPVPDDVQNPVPILKDWWWNSELITMFNLYQTKNA